MDFVSSQNSKDTMLNYQKKLTYDSGSYQDLL